MPLQPGTPLGPYEIVSPIGAGGMGEVYRARDMRLDRDVAIKVLPLLFADDADRRARFEREAKAVAALSHPNILAIFDTGVHDGQMFVVTELLDGETLRTELRSGALPVKKSVVIAGQIARGLAAAHDKGLVHRDLKPENVFLLKDGQVKILDFGLARPMPTSTNVTETAAALTDPGGVVGTVGYMAPEQVRGLATDQRADLFALGAVLYEMLCGQRAFPGETAMDAMTAILNKDPPNLPVSERRIPISLERIVGRCVEKSPASRFQSARDLEFALENLSAQSSATEPADGVAAAKRREQIAWLVAAASVLTVLVGGAWWLRSPRSGTVSLPLRQLTFETGVALMPALSPDGKLLAYVSDRAGDGYHDVWLKQMAGGDALRITWKVGAVSDVQFSADGTTLYYLQQGNGIFSVPTFGGTARKLVDGAGPFSVSSEGEIAFVRPGTGVAGASVNVVQANGGTPVVLQPECVSWTAPAWSPDGQRVAFVGVCLGRGGLFWAPRQGGSVHEILSGQALQLGPSVVTESLGGHRLALWARIAWFRLPDGPEGLMVSLRRGDSVNLSRVTLDGSIETVTQGTGWELSPAVSMTGEMVFARAELTPTIWSLPVGTTAADQARPQKESAPGVMFGTSRDGTKLVFGRMASIDQGQLVLRDRPAATETVLATHDVVFGGTGSFFTAVSPDGSQAVYRVISASRPALFVVSTTLGNPRIVEPDAAAWLSLGSDWSADGRRILGECLPAPTGICELDPADGKVQKLSADSQGGDLLYPSWSWDGKWITFMLRRKGASASVICVAPVRNNRTLGPETEWVEISPQGATGLRSRFGSDGAHLYYLLDQNRTRTLVQQALDVRTKRPIGLPVTLWSIPFMPVTMLVPLGSPFPTVTVTHDRVFFNTVEVHSNLWMTQLK